jgi:hypothetical protein
MASRLIQTSLCPVTVNGRVRGADGPAILCVRGWAPQSYMNELLELFPDVDILLGDLPGMWTAPPEVGTPEAFSRAYDEVIAQLLRGRRIVALGASTGALVTLGLNSQEVRAHVLLEPFFSTANLWPLVDDMQGRLAEFPDDQVLARCVFDLYGITREGVEPRDLGHLFDQATAPVHAIVGELPLEPRREMDGWPSLADDATRERIAAKPGARLHIGPPGSGHHLTPTPAGWALLTAVLGEALAAA